MATSSDRALQCIRTREHDDVIVIVAEEEERVTLYSTYGESRTFCVYYKWHIQLRCSEVFNRSCNKKALVVTKYYVPPSSDFVDQVTTNHFSLPSYSLLISTSWTVRLGSEVKQSSSFQ